MTGAAAHAQEPPPPRALPPALAAALVFAASGAVLVLEILAVRLLAPYVGLTLETTTSIIGAALAGIAAGAALGGWLADRTDTRRLIVWLLIGGGALAMLTLPAVRLLGEAMRGEGDAAALFITIVALVPAAAVLSAVSPAVAHLQLRDLRVSGTVVGGLSAWGTAGALVGTFGTGFVLVPLIPVSAAVLGTGAAVAAIGVGLGVWGRILTPATTLAAIAAVIGVALIGLLPSTPCDTESDYHCVSLEADPASATGVELLLDNVHNSYVDLEDPTRLEYRYTRWIGEAIDARFPPPEAIDAVFVGGGGFTLPRWLVETRPGSSAEVLELDGGVVEFVEDRLGLVPSAELRVTVGDARVSALDLADDSADVVVGDAFSGYSVPWHLTTVEWLEEVRRVLRPGGLYALNLIDMQPLRFVEAEIATLLAEFEDVQVVAIPGEDGMPAGGNVVVLASERPIPSPSPAEATVYPRLQAERMAAGAEVLRDDHAPVDQLLTVE